MARMMDHEAVGRRRDEALRSFVERLLRYDTTDGEELPAQEWVRERLESMGMDVYEWEADAERLAEHDSFPDDPTDVAVVDRPSVAGVVEFDDPDDGPTLVLNGHVDVVPAERESWDTDPFEPTWGTDAEGTETLTARGAADMKAGLATCVFAARDLASVAEDPDGPDLSGRLVVESVAGEEEGGIGAAAAALSNPYPFERDAALVAEPTELRPVTTCAGTVMMRLGLTGRSAHAATRWRGESVLPHFRRIHDAFEALEAERAEGVTHPLYDRFDIPWPVNVGVVRAGSWASSVTASLTAEWRIGVAPGETVEEVQAAFERRLRAVVEDDEWLAEHPPTFERFSIQFEPSEIDPDEPLVRRLQGAMVDAGLDPDPVGATYGADARHYVAAGIPTVVFGPGSIHQAHFPDESIRWPEVRTATGVIADAAARFLAGG